MTGTSELQQPRLASDNLILEVVAAYAAAFVVFGFLVQAPADVLRGLGAILTTRDALLTDYFGVGGIGGGCVSAGLLTLAGTLRLLARWRKGDRRVRRGPLSRARLRPVRQEPSQCLADRRGRCALRAVPRRALSHASQHRVLRRRARADLFRDPVFHRPHADGQRPARSRDRARGRLHPSARGRASVQGAHGVQPLQHGVHRRASSARSSSRCTNRSATCPIRSSSGRTGPNGVARRISRPRVRLDGRRRLFPRPGRARTPARSCGRRRADLRRILLHWPASARRSPTWGSPGRSA